MSHVERIERQHAALVRQVGGAPAAADRHDQVDGGLLLGGPRLRQRDLGQQRRLLRHDNVDVGDQAADVELLGQAFGLGRGPHRLKLGLVLRS